MIWKYSQTNHIVYLNLHVEDITYTIGADFNNMTEMDVYRETLMASYATFKELYDSKEYRSPYQILSEFIRYVIVSRPLRFFTSTDMQNHLSEEFGFQLPLAVIRTSVKSIQGVTLQNQTYQVESVQKRDTVQNHRRLSEEKGVKVTEALLLYAKEKGFEQLDAEKLARELIAFELDEEGDSEYQKLIGAFVLANEKRPEITDAISAVREGSILYAGLSFNISEYGSLENPLVLFLDTEILFHIMGYNGSLYEKLTAEFLDLVRIANQGERRVTLRFFPDVAEEIKQFFFQAERMMTFESDPIVLKQAMKKIVEDCASESDVAAKKTSFFYRLEHDYGIREDEKKNYYDEQDYENNLEGIELEGYPLSEEANWEGYRFCSHIHKLRKGWQAKEELSSRALLVTGTQRVLDISRAMAENLKQPKDGGRYCGYAVNLSRITNLLWYKLNRGYGSTEFPQNLDAVIKARTILSGYITQGISISYQEIRRRESLGELSEDEIAARLIVLRRKATLPEDLDADNVEESLNFTEKHLTAIEETLSLNKVLLCERDKTIERLSNQMEGLYRKLSQKDEENRKKQGQIDALTHEVDIIREERKRRKRRWAIARACLRMFWDIGWKISLGIALPYGGQRICEWRGINFDTWLGITISTIPLLVALVSIVKADWRRFLSNLNEARHN